MTDGNEGFTEEQLAEIKAASDAVNRAMKPLEDAFMTYVEMCKEVGYGRMVQLLQRKLGWTNQSELIRRIDKQARALETVLHHSKQWQWISEVRRDCDKPPHEQVLAIITFDEGIEMTDPKTPEEWATWIGEQMRQQRVENGISF